MRFQKSLPAPTAEELGMWRHVSWATAVTMYARRVGLNPREGDDRERVKDVFRAAPTPEETP